MPIEHEPEQNDDDIDVGARSAGVGLAVAVSILSLPFLGAFAWLYRLFADGLSGGVGIEGIVVDYFVIGVVYVGFLAIVTAFGLRSFLRGVATTQKLVRISMVAYAIPVVAFGVANVVIEVGDAGNDEVVAAIAGVAAIIGPGATFALRIPRAAR
ncbi:MAG: hypothetical protein H7287_13435 [Thermoleophilia bacterium]|nr:hypothetical protein [Thermoleophilia bacterium]